MIITRPGATLDAEILKLRHRAVVEQRTAADNMVQAAIRARQQLEQDAETAGLGAELSKLDHPAPPPPPPDRSEPRVRIRLLDGISTEHLGLPFYGPKGTVADWPRSLAAELVKHGRAEHAPDAELYRPPVAW